TRISPASRAFEFADLAKDQIALDPAQSIEEERPFEVVDFVLEGTGQQAGAFYFLFVPVPVEPACGDSRRTTDRRREARHAQAAFVFDLHAVARHDLGIHQRDHFAPLAADAEIDDTHAQGHPDLRRRQSNPRRGVHRRNHVVDQSGDLVVDAIDGVCRPAEDRIAVFDDGTNHQARVDSGVRRRRRRAAYWRTAASMSAMVSPPNFSSTASASTRHTIASPTTDAAGTAHVSLRSMAAGESARVVRSIDRSGFISVEMGFIQPLTRTPSPLVTPPSR